MFPLIGSAISGLSNLVGGYFSSQTSAANTQAQIQAQQAMLNQTQEFNQSERIDAQNWNAGMAANQQNYESNMSNSAYQRASLDMKAAGLNPAMMFSGGSAASTPQVSAPQTQGASVGTPNVPMPQNTHALAGLGNAVGSAVNTAISAQTFDKMTEEIANLRTQGAKMAAETATERERPELVRQMATREGTTALKQTQESSHLGLSMPKSELTGKEARAILDMPEWLRNTAIQGGYLGRKVDDVISPIANSAGAIRRFLPTTRESSGVSHGPSGTRTFDSFWKERLGY